MVTNNWKAQDTTAAEYVGIVELDNGEHFEIVKTDTHFVFGSATNMGLLESGNYPLDSYVSDDAILQELVCDLNSYYRDGAGYQSEEFSHNDRM